MNRESCANCGEILPAWSRADRRTCSVRCRVALQRRSGATKRGLAVLRTAPTSAGPVTGIAGVTSLPSPSASDDDPVAVTDEDVLIRLSTWLAEVSVEATLAAAAEPVAS